MEGCATTEVKKQVGEQVRGMKVRSSIKKFCEGCKVSVCVSLVLEGRRYVER